MLTFLKFDKWDIVYMKHVFRRLFAFCFMHWIGIFIIKLSNILNSNLTPAMYKGHIKKISKESDPCEYGYNN